MNFSVNDVSMHSQCETQSQSEFRNNIREVYISGI